MSCQRRTVAWLIILLWVLSVPTKGQSQKSASDKPDRKVLSYAFVSPNVSSDPSLHKAIRNLSSSEEHALIANVRAIACRVGIKLQVSKAIGFWSEGAEESTVLRLKADEPTLRYLVSHAGESARQKSVFYFQYDISGNASLYILSPSQRFRSPFTISRVLDKTDLINRTLVPRRQTTLIYIVILNNDMARRVLLATRRLHAQIKSLRGTAKFIGDDSDREKARHVFQKEIKDYEVAHRPQRSPCSTKRSTSDLPWTSRGEAIDLAELLP